MCGIFVQWGSPVHLAALQESMKRLAYRGEGEPVIVTEHLPQYAYGFHRFHVMGSTQAQQPYSLSDGRVVMCNGEIYNYKILANQYGIRLPHDASDCDIIPALLEGGRALDEICPLLDGDFAIVVLDAANHVIQAARDPYGLRPLFYGTGDDGWKILTSDPVAYPDSEDHSGAIPPGECWTIPFLDDTAFAPIHKITWHTVPWLKIPYWRSSLEGITQGGMAIRHALEEAVVKRLQVAAPYTVGVLLTTDVASWILAGIAGKIMHRQGRPFHIFGDDSVRVTRIAEHVKGIPHAEKEEEEQMDVRVLLTDHGASTLFGPWSPSEHDGLVDQQITSDLRTLSETELISLDKDMLVRKQEARCPYLDRQFVALVRSFPVDALRVGRHTKSFLRTVFSENGVLPSGMIWDE